MKTIDNTNISYDSQQYDICKERFKNIESLMQNISEKVNSITLCAKENTIILDLLKKKLDKIEVDIYGNGKNGLRDDVNNLINLEKKRDRIISFILSAFITQIIGLLFVIVNKFVKIF